MIRSSGRRWAANAMPYCIPEHPPPLTKMRRPRLGFSSLASNSLRRDWASGVSETRACSITAKMLPRVLAFTSPLAGWRFGLSPPRLPGRSAAKPPGGGLALPPTQLESLPFALGIGGCRAGDDLSQLLRAAGKRALGIGQDEDLAPDRRLVGLGPVEVDLDRQLLLQGANDVLLAHHRLRDLVVEREDDPARDDVQDVGEDVQQLAHVLEGRKLGGHEYQHALGVIEDADHDVGERDAEVEDDIAERVDQDAHGPVHEVDRYEVRLLRAEHTR